MKSLATRQFWARFEALPDDVQTIARDAFMRWVADSHHPGLSFKCVNVKLSLWSVRIGMHWRAVGKREGDVVTWFWIGSHADYDKLLTRR